MACLEDAKAESTTLIDLHGKTSIADAMIITTGRSNTHVAAIAERVLKALKGRRGFGVPRIRGPDQRRLGVLIDAGDAIVHVFRPKFASSTISKRCGRRAAEGGVVLRTSFSLAG